jgi:hypothetical protein
VTAIHAPNDVDLTVRLTESPGAPGYTFRLVASDGIVSSASTLPDPAAALEAVQRHGEGLFFPKPAPGRICTQQYGGPQTAVVRTDGCEIARWRAMAPLLGGSAGSTGAI